MTFSPPLMISPRLTLRVGVTGTREVSMTEQAALRTGIARILGWLQEQLNALSRRSEALEVYALTSAAEVTVDFQAISALAEGADRLFAEEAISRGYRLLAPLPFDKTEYEEDFPASSEEYRSLLSQAQIFELDGNRENATSSYEAVGHFIVRNVDILVAVWDGKPGRGPGGTADVVRLAARSRIPVWWINARSGEPRLIARQSHWRHLELALGGPAAELELVQYLEALIFPPAVPHPHRGGLLGRAAHVFCRIFERDQHPLALYLAEKVRGAEGDRRSLISRLHSARAASPSQPPVNMLSAETSAETFWEQHYKRADTLSLVYGNLYRSSYISIIFFALLAFITAIIGRLVLPEWAQSAAEFGVLLLIGWLVWRNNIGNWQERWITYRLLAELCRKQIILAPLARTLPGIDVKRLAIDAGLPVERNELPREAWVSWYFTALVRSAPWPQLSINIGKRRAFVLARSLVAEQIDYHRARRLRSKGIDRLLLTIRDGLFFLTLLLLTLSLSVALTGGQDRTLDWIESLALSFSALSATLVSLKSYAEFSLLARQSQHMESVLDELSNELTDLNLELPLASLELGSILHRLTLSMMQEVGGWAQIFRLKAVESQ